MQTPKSIVLNRLIYDEVTEHISAVRTFHRATLLCINAIESSLLTTRTQDGFEWTPDNALELVTRAVLDLRVLKFPEDAVLRAERALRQLAGAVLIMAGPATREPEAILLSLEGVTADLQDALKGVDGKPGLNIYADRLYSYTVTTGVVYWPDDPPTPTTDSD